MQAFYSKFKNTLPNKFTLSHTQQIGLWGSCFAKNMFCKFIEMGFATQSNPFGVLFNPKSIAILFQKINLKNKLESKEIIQTNMGFTSLLTHSKFSFETEKELLDQFELESKKTIQKQVFIISLGTAWIYQHHETELYCANCHKLSKNQFSKTLLSSLELEQSFQEIENCIFNWNKDNKIIYTLSPVRHLKDGFIENQQSKSRLHCAILERVKHPSISYFPAYEILMDELRDYRFYKPDLIHPNQQAIEHIWEYFEQNYFTKTELNIGEESKKYYQLSAHKVLNNNPLAKKQHQEKVLKLKKSIQEKYPTLFLS